MSTRVAPIFPVSDVSASLDYYSGLGFGTRRWRGGGYGFLTFEGVEIHLGEEPDLATRPDRRATAYLFVDDADALAETWLAFGADVRLPEDTEWGQHEGVLVDPDGNMIRFGSPMSTGLPAYRPAPESTRDCGPLGAAAYGLWVIQSISAGQRRAQSGGSVCV